jgi:hypothetical protein
MRLASSAQLALVVASIRPPRRLSGLTHEGEVLSLSYCSNDE